jgi:hypothetical protein
MMSSVLKEAKKAEDYLQELRDALQENKERRVCIGRFMEDVSMPPAYERRQAANEC